MLAILRRMRMILGRLIACFRRPRSKAVVTEMLSMSEYVWLDLKNPGYQSSYPESYFP